MDKNTLLIATSGYAQSKFLEAIRDTRLKSYDSALKNFEEASVKLDEAMALNSEITQNDEALTLLMVHAHNYLMNALMMKNLAYEMIEFMKSVRYD